MLSKPHKINSTQPKLPKIATLSLCLGFILLGINNANAALSATTANVIQGTSPFFTGDDYNRDGSFKYFAVKYNNQKYFNSNDLNNALSSLKLDPFTATPNDIKNDLTPALSVPSSPTQSEPISIIQTDANDTDGDQTFTLEQELAAESKIKLEWYTYLASQKTLSDADLNKTFCQLAIEGKNPALRVSGPVVLKTKFGYPNDNVYSDFKKDFEIYKAIKPTTCYIAPNDRYGDNEIVWTVSHNFVKAGAGWDPKTTPRTFDASKKFPTTGFKGAKFRIIMAGISHSAAARYGTVGTSGDTSNGVTLTFSDNYENTGFTTAIVELSGEPANTASPTLTFTITENNRFTPLYKFTISKWFKFIKQRDTYANAKTACSYPYTLPLISDLTDSTIKNPEKDNTKNNYQRAVNGSLLSEWGIIENNVYYNNSDWRPADYWTQELYPSDNSSAYTVSSDVGFVNKISITATPPNDYINWGVSCVLK